MGRFSLCKFLTVSPRMSMPESAWWHSPVPATTQLWNLCPVLGVLECYGFLVPSNRCFQEMDTVDFEKWKLDIFFQISLAFKRAFESNIFLFHASAHSTQLGGLLTYDIELLHFKCPCIYSPLRDFSRPTCVSTERPAKCPCQTSFFSWQVELEPRTWLAVQVLPYFCRRTSEKEVTSF